MRYFHLIQYRDPRLFLKLVAKINLNPEYFIYYIGINDSILLLKSLNKYEDKRNYNEADVLVDEKLFERQSS